MYINTHSYDTFIINPCIIIAYYSLSLIIALLFFLERKQRKRSNRHKQHNKQHKRPNNNNSIHKHIDLNIKIMRFFPSTPFPKLLIPKYYNTKNPQPQMQYNIQHNQHSLYIIRDLFVYCMDDG
jgi:hypothetical protein